MPAMAPATTPSQGANVASHGMASEYCGSPAMKVIGEAGDRAEQHHALDAEIEDAALLDDEFAGRRQQDRRRDVDDGDDRRDEEIDDHFVAP